MQSITTLMSFLFILALLTNCGTTQQYDTAAMAPAQMEKSREANEPARKIIYNAYLTMAVEQPDSTNKQIEGIVEQLDGYVSEMGTYRTVVRVESDQLDSALEAIKSLGKIRSQSKSGQDVTEDYLDYQIRLDNALKARERYLELLEKAETVEAALQVEKELERLNETIDLLKGRMSRIDHLATYATITINLRERKKPGVLGYVGLGVYHAVKWLFVRN